MGETTPRPRRYQSLGLGCSGAERQLGHLNRQCSKYIGSSASISMSPDGLPIPPPPLSHCRCSFCLWWAVCPISFPFVSKPSFTLHVACLLFFWSHGNLHLWRGAMFPWGNGPSTTFMNQHRFLSDFIKEQFCWRLENQEEKRGRGGLRQNDLSGIVVFSGVQNS